MSLMEWSRHEPSGEVEPEGGAPEPRREVEGEAGEREGGVASTSAGTVTLPDHHDGSTPPTLKLLLVVDTNVLLRPSSLDALKLVCRLFGPGASTEARRGAGRGGAAGADVEVAGLLTITVMKELDRLKVRGPGPGQVWR